MVSVIDQKFHPTVRPQERAEISHCRRLLEKMTNNEHRWAHYLAEVRKKIDHL